MGPLEAILSALKYFQDFGSFDGYGFTVDQETGDVIVESYYEEHCTKHLVRLSTVEVQRVGV